MFFVFCLFLRNLGENYVRAIEIHTSRRVSAFQSPVACMSPRVLLFFAEIRDYSQSTLGNTLLREREQEGKTETCPKYTLLDKVTPQFQHHLCWEIKAYFEKAKQNCSEFNSESQDFEIMWNIWQPHEHFNYHSVALLLCLAPQNKTKLCIKVQFDPKKK